MSNTPDSTVHQPAAWLDVVRNQVNSLRFGQIQIVVHNSQVVQVEKTERIRFNQPPKSDTDFFQELNTH
jgi:hypothetical protein